MYYAYAMHAMCTVARTCYMLVYSSTYMPYAMCTVARAILCVRTYVYTATVARACISHSVHIACAMILTLLQ